MTTPDEDVAISEDVLQKFRLYLGLMKRVEYEIAEEQQQVIATEKACSCRLNQNNYDDRWSRMISLQCEGKIPIA